LGPIEMIDPADGEGAGEGAGESKGAPLPPSVGGHPSVCGSEVRRDPGAGAGLAAAASRNDLAEAAGRGNELAQQRLMQNKVRICVRVRVHVCGAYFSCPRLLSFSKLYIWSGGARTGAGPRGARPVPERTRPARGRRAREGLAYRLVRSLCSTRTRTRPRPPAHTHTWQAPCMRMCSPARPCDARPHMRMHGARAGTRPCILLAHSCTRAARRSTCIRTHTLMSSARVLVHMHTGPYIYVEFVEEIFLGCIPILEEACAHL